MAVHFYFSSSFEEARLRIEQHLFDSALKIEKDEGPALESVNRFSKAMDRLADTLEQMYQTPDLKDTQGEKSFPIRDGHFRVFFKVAVRTDEGFDITFIDVDHNKQSNIDRFPTHQMISFDEED
jgi:hypothetical protein